MINNKRIIFFDGDGTVWYPKKTKRKTSPYWVYKDKKIGKKYLKYLVLVPFVNNALRKLKKKGIILILLSTFPQKRKIADVLLVKKVRYLKLENLFDEIYTARDYPESKGEIITKILKEKHISKSKALMIGDSYRYDYKPAKQVGVDALLIKSEYLKIPKGRGIKTITGINNLL